MHRRRYRRANVDEICGRRSLFLDTRPVIVSQAASSDIDIIDIATLAVGRESRMRAAPQQTHPDPSTRQMVKFRRRRRSFYVPCRFHAVAARRQLFV